MSSDGSNVKKNKTEPTPEDILASLMSDLKNIDVKVDDTNSLKLSDDESENSNVNSELNPPDLLEFPEINKASLNKLNFKLNENQNSEDNHFQNEQTQHPNHSEDLNTLNFKLDDENKSIQSETKSKNLFLNPELNIDYQHLDDDLMIANQFDISEPAESVSLSPINDHYSLSESDQNNEYESTSISSIKEEPISISTEDIPVMNFESSVVSPFVANPDKTEVLTDLSLSSSSSINSTSPELNSLPDERTVAVAGYAQRVSSNSDPVPLKVSVGQSSRSGSMVQTVGNGFHSESQIALAEHLKIAQEKIYQLQSENDQLRNQNDELLSASQIIKERSEVQHQQIQELLNDRQNFESNLKEENKIFKLQLQKKEAELIRLQDKISELESRLSFDLKKIRLKERDLENRLELLRSEKNALVKSKDEQILEYRRQMDQLELVKESYRQKCVELNKSLEANQESFKKATRVLRLAMANLEMQEDVKSSKPLTNQFPLKKVE